MPKTAFIVSSGRTGTKFLAEFFCANMPDVLALHEPAPTRPLRLLGNAHLAGRVSPSVMAATLRRSRARLMRRRAGRDYIESNPFLFGFTDVLHEVFADSLIFHLVRDPRDFVRSSINYGSWSGLKWLAANCIPFWFPDVQGLLGIREKLTPVGIFAGHWRLVNEFVSTHAGAQSRYHRLRYEDVFGPDNTGLRRMCELLSREYPGPGSVLSATEKINAGKLALLGPWEGWTPAQCQELERACGDLMRTYGYGTEPTWKKLVG